MPLEEPLIKLTERAANKIQQLLSEEGNSELKLRVYVMGGGCSGFQYGFGFEEIQKEDDTLISDRDIPVLIDPMSLQYVEGSEIDYLQGLEGARFVVNNPNAQTTCGCGSSFAVD